ncbi:MAG: hypothetical protein ACI4EU_02940 [Butyrivibrio sp.]
MRKKALLKENKHLKDTIVRLNEEIVKLSKIKDGKLHDAGVWCLNCENHYTTSEMFRVNHSCILDHPCKDRVVKDTK